MHTNSRQTAQVQVLNIYTKNSVFEGLSLPPAATEPRVQPILDPLVINPGDAKIKDNVYEAILMIQIVAKQGGNTLWKLQLRQAALCNIQGLSEKEREKFLNVQCMAQLFPYAVAEINHLVSHAGFGPIYLAPINFEQAYRQQLAREEAKTAVSKATATPLNMEEEFHSGDDSEEEIEDRSHQKMTSKSSC